MTVEVELFGQLLPDQPRRQNLEIEGPAAVRDIAHTLELDPEDIGLISIDGVQSELDDVVKSGSRLCFFPYLTGG